MIASKTKVREYTEKKTRAGRSKYYYGPLDAQGRATEARAKLIRPLPKGEYAAGGIRPAGFPPEGTKTKHLFARGHLIARTLGGAGTGEDGRKNLVTLYQNPVNTPIMYGFEFRIRAAVEAGEVVEYTVKPVYKGAGMPVAVILRAKGSKGFRLPGGVVIIPNRPD
jgi:hypothetical protein